MSSGGPETKNIFILFLFSGDSNLQNLINNMDQNQLMQLLGMTGLGGAGGAGGLGADTEAKSSSRTSTAKRYVILLL